MKNPATKDKHPPEAEDEEYESDSVDMLEVNEKKEKIESDEEEWEQEDEDEDVWQNTSEDIAATPDADINFVCLFCDGVFLGRDSLNQHYENSHRVDLDDGGSKSVKFFHFFFH